MIEGMTTPSIRCGFSGRQVRFIAQSDGENIYLAKERLCRRTNTWKKYPGSNGLDDVVLKMMADVASQESYVQGFSSYDVSPFNQRS